MNPPAAPPDVSADLLIDALEALSEGIAIYDKDERLVICNARYRELLGAVGDIVEPGMLWQDLIKGCIREGIVAPTTDEGEDWIAESERKRIRFEQETEITQTDGRTFQISYHPTNSGGFVVTREDITERRAAEERVRAHDALLGTIMDTNPTPVVMARVKDGKVLFLSPAARATYGDMEFIGDYYVDPDARAEYIAELKTKGRVQEKIVQAWDTWGGKHTISLSGRLTEYNGERCVVSSVTDLTEQLEREALIRKVVESCPAPVLMNRAATGEILFKSPEVSALFGDGDDTSAFYVNATDRSRFLSTLRQAGEVHEYRARLWNAKGKAIWAAVSARLIRWEGEEVIVSHSRDLSGQLQIEDELSRQREQIFQNEKMSALGSLLAGVAHELNNPLSVVVGHAMMLQDEVTDPDVQRQIGKISDAAERCAKIVKTFLTMARQEPVRMDETDVNDVVQTAVEVARFGDASRGVQIATDLDMTLPRVTADADQITQVIINLILNAEQAIADAETGDLVTVRTDLNPRGQVRISVEDNGPGVPSDIRARVFEPFFTTKDVGQGTGIGLAVCHRIVSAHDGTIRLEPVVPRGARFNVSLPPARPAQADTGPESPSEALAKSARVLVIDDEPDVADLNAEVLERGGFKTCVVYKAEDAFAKLRESTFDAIISDLNMPGVDGRLFFDTIRSEFSEMVPHTGFITGDTMGQSSQRFLKDAARPYIEKPVSPGELRAFVHSLSAGRDGP
ncbi:MAG: ATP-binding protein [Pseudomonadota bacterium]